MGHPGQLSPGRPELLTSSVERCRGRPPRPSPLALRRARSPRDTRHTGATALPRHQHSRPGGRQHARTRPPHAQPPADQGPQTLVVATPAQASTTEARSAMNPAVPLDTRPLTLVSRGSLAARIGTQTTTGCVVVVADSSTIGSSSALPGRRLDHRPSAKIHGTRPSLAGPIGQVRLQVDCAVDRRHLKGLSPGQRTIRIETRC